MPDQKPHVDGAVERIEHEVEIEIRGQFAARDSAAQGGVGLGPARLQKAFAEGVDQGGVALSGAKDYRENMAAAAAQNPHQLLHLLAHVLADRAGIRKVEFLGDAAGECVGHQRGLVGPPAVDRRLAHTGLCGHVFNRQVGKSVSFRFQKLQRAAQDRLAGTLAARTSRGRACCWRLRNQYLLSSHRPMLAWHAGFMMEIMIQYVLYRI